MIEVHVDVLAGAVIIQGRATALAMSYAEANKLQEDIRQALINEGVTLRDAS